MNPIKHKRDRNIDKFLIAITVFIFVIFVSFQKNIVADDSNWALLANAMSGGSQESVDNVFVVDDTSEPGVRKIQLLVDITATEGDSVLSVPNGKTIYLDLNSFTLNRNRQDATDYIDDGSVISNRGTLTITDTSVTKTGTITGGKASFGGGIYNFDGKLTISNINIKENASQNGGGIFVSGDLDPINYGICNIDNVNIFNNTSSGYGGGIYDFVGVLDIKSARITNNHAKFGGGVYSQEYGSIVSFYTDEGKSIEITGNTATDAVGGIALLEETHFSGKIIIKDNICNTRGKTNNLAIPGVIDINDLLTGSEIYFTCINRNNYSHILNEITHDYIVTNPGAGTDDFFHYDGHDDFYVILNERNELEVFCDYYVDDTVKKINEDNIEDVVFVSEAHFSKFQDVIVDGLTLVRDIDYTVESGSTIVTLKSAYIKDLSIGNHILEIKSGNTTKAFKFKIIKNSPPKYHYSIPNTGVKVNDN